MGKAEDAIREQIRREQAGIAEQEEEHARIRDARIAELLGEVRVLVPRALKALERAGYPGGVLLTVADRGKSRFSSKPRFSSAETAVFKLFDDENGGVYLASNGKLVISGVHIGPHYLGLDKIDFNRKPESQLRLLEGTRAGLLRFIGPSSGSASKPPMRGSGSKSPDLPAATARRKDFVCVTSGCPATGAPTSFAECALCDRPTRLR